MTTHLPNTQQYLIKYWSYKNGITTRQENETEHDYQRSKTAAC